MTEGTSGRSCRVSSGRHDIDHTEGSEDCACNAIVDTKSPAIVSDPAGTISNSIDVRAS